MSRLVSVIVPVYNVEKYLGKCVDSILNQTYTDYEVILVDDGSKDSSGTLCDQFAQQNEKIRVVHKKNGGLSDARNAGVEVAKGEYVTFIDSDDYVANRYLEILMKGIAEADAQICVGGLQTFYENENPSSDIREEEIQNSIVMSGLEALENMLYQNMLDTSACAMILEKKVAQMHPFPVGKYHEDEMTTYKYYTSVQRVAVSTNKVYFYLQREKSIMHSFGQASMDELDAADNLVNVCKDKWPGAIKAAESKKFSDYCQVYLSDSTIYETNPEVYKRIVSYLKSIRSQILWDKRTRRKNKIAAFALLFGPQMLEFLNRIVTRRR